MIKKFNIQSYTAQLQTLGVSEKTITGLSAVIQDELPGFESSSRSVAMLAHSTKMSRSMKIGSKLENAGRLSDEVNPLVSGFFFKVGELVISFENNAGESCTVRHRPDALRLLTLPASVPTAGFRIADFMHFAEFKSSEVLTRLCQESGRYTFDKKTNRFRCPAAEASAASLLGIGYEIITERDLDPVVVSNSELLHCYWDRRAQAVPPDITARVRETVGSKQGLSLSELTFSVPGLTKDHFYKLIADQRIYVPLEFCELDLPTTVQVFSDRLSCEAFGSLVPTKREGLLKVRYRFPTFEVGEIVTIRGKRHTVVAPSPTAIMFRDDFGESITITLPEIDRLIEQKQISSLGVPQNYQEEARKLLLSTPPPKLGPAVDRLRILQPVLDGKCKVSKIANLLPNAKVWLRRARLASIKYGNPLPGCIDNRASQGWRGSHLSPEADSLINETIGSHYLSPLAPTRSAAYGEYRRICRERCRPPVSEKTFRKRIAKLVADKSAKARLGAMASASVEAPVSKETLLAGGGRWFMHVVHTDEFVVDLATVFPELGFPLGTAWCVVMVDSFTRTILSVTVSFEPPSYITTMVALRECVARWGRLPEIFLGDNGPGFKNLSLVLFAKYYGMQLEWRPAGKPRWGAEVERLVGVINQRIAGELPGGTKCLNRLRRMSKTHHPDELAIFGLQTVAEILQSWCYTEYDTLPHAGLHGKTPASMRKASMRDQGERLHLSIADDPLFPIISLPAVDGDGTAKVQAHDGVQVDNLYYWNDRFDDPELVGTYVEVRWDPFDITKVYAFVKDEWVECACTKLLKLRRLAKNDLCAASLEIRKGRSDYNRLKESILERVAAFLDAKRKSGEELARLLRTKESARQFLTRMQPPSFDDDPPAANSVTTGPAPRPAIPGIKGVER